MRRALTLIELCLSLGILASLTGVLIPAVQQARESAKRKAVRCDFAAIEAAIKEYKAKTGKMPTSLSELGDTVPKVDPWGTPYHLAAQYAVKVRPDAPPGLRTIPVNHYTIGGKRPRHIAFQVTSAGPDRQRLPFGEWSDEADDLANFTR